MGNHPEYIHRDTVDGSTKYGGCIYCFPRRTKVGGDYGANTYCGSRSINSNLCTIHTNPAAS